MAAKATSVQEHLRSLASNDRVIVNDVLKIGDGDADFTGYQGVRNMEIGFAQGTLGSGLIATFFGFNAGADSLRDSILNETGDFGMLFNLALRM